MVYYLIHEYSNYSHSELLEESEDFDLVKKEFLLSVEQTLAETDSTTDALYIEDDNQEVIIEHIFNAEPED